MSYLDIQYVNNKQLQIFSDLLDILRETYSVSSGGVRIAGKFRPNRSYAITPTGLISTGFAVDIIRHVTANYRNCKITIDPKAMQAIKPAVSLDRQVTNFQLRDYQEAAFQQCIKRGRGIVLHPTSAGKTPIIAALALHYSALSKPNKPVLVIVPDPGLALQMFNDLDRFGVESLAIWHRETDIVDFSPYKVIIVSHKLLWVRKQDAIKMFGDSCVVLIDECHMLNKGNLINKFVDKLTTQIRFGFTGTMPDTVESQWNVIGKIGPIIAEEKSYVLSERGYIAGVKAFCCVLNYQGSPPATQGSVLQQYANDIKWLSAHKYRTETVSKLAAATTKNTLILVDRLASGLLIQERLQQICGKQVFFVSGEMEIEVREQVKKIMESNNDVVCIAMMKIFRQGISINNIHYVILAALGRGRSRFIQAIGRGRRLHTDKFYMILFDIIDNVGYCMQHGHDRIAVYQQELIQVKVFNYYENGNP